MDIRWWLATGRYQRSQVRFIHHRNDCSQITPHRYNLSYIIQQSTLNQKPVIGISINYRMAAFGFISSKEIDATCNQNLGLRDQRLAMQWVNKHISAFGGDPDKVTIWGESAGAYSVGDHINAYNGDTGGLFRAAIMESGGAVGAPLNGTDWYQHMYDELVASVGCANATDSLSCIRTVPYEKIAPYLAYADKLRKTA